MDRPCETNLAFVGLRSASRIVSIRSRALTRQRWIDVVKRLAVSTGQLKAFLLVHLRPINVVVFDGPSIPEGIPRPHLEGGFTLRCIQRLSSPNIATQRCP